MGNYSLDFTKSKRGTMPVKYSEMAEGSDKQETRTLLIKTPSKRVMDALFDIQDSISDYSENEQIETIYNLVKECMNNNLNGIKVNREWLETHFSLSDLIEFISTYTNFVKEEISHPN